ncbi:unnamed protein product [Citrullus colocynthis]|uniref:Uncharacterized protein n=1 Tax=Citrullus colocynthis TaxID=252529 RepID=A0ABP0YG97_9ROSI
MNLLQSPTKTITGISKPEAASPIADETKWPPTTHQIPPSSIPSSFSFFFPEFLSPSGIKTAPTPLAVSGGGILQHIPANRASIMDRQPRNHTIRMIEMLARQLPYFLSDFEFLFTNRTIRILLQMVLRNFHPRNRLNPGISLWSGESERDPRLIGFESPLRDNRGGNRAISGS